MIPPSTSQILRLYRDLLRYGKSLQLTDKEYFCKRIRTEFQNNKTCTEVKDIVFNFEKGKSLLEKGRVL